jgi:ankyrin repeat protein
MIKKGYYMQPMSISSIISNSFSYPDQSLSLHQVIREKCPREQFEALVRLNPATLDEKVDGKTALYLACCEGNIDAVEVLVQAGASLNEKNGPNEETALYIAAGKGHKAIVELLCVNNADKEVKDKDSWTPLFNACIRGHLEAAQVLIKAGASLNEKNGPNEETALYIAAGKGHPAIIKLLCANNADKDAKDENNRTPLFKACISGHLEAAQALIEAGASVNEKNGLNKETALQGAVLWGHTAIVKMFGQLSLS